jgi:hypothetical protein
MEAHTNAPNMPRRNRQRRGSHGTGHHHHRHRGRAAGLVVMTILAAVVELARRPSAGGGGGGGPPHMAHGFSPVMRSPWSAWPARRSGRALPSPPPGVGPPEGGPLGPDKAGRRGLYSSSSPLSWKSHHGSPTTDGGPAEGEGGGGEVMISPSPSSLRSGALPPPTGSSAKERTLSQQIMDEITHRYDSFQGDEMPTATEGPSPLPPSGLGPSSKKSRSQQWRITKNYLWKFHHRLSMTQVLDVLDFLDQRLPGPVVRSILQQNPGVL